MATFKLYTDAGLTTPFTGDLLTQHVVGVNDPVDKVLYLGSTGTDLKLETKVNPGVDSLLLTPTDSNPGSDHETTEIKLASTQLGLDSATAGAALNLGTVINSGTANKKEIWIRATNAVNSVSSLTDISLVLTAASEAGV